jgi:futalosine hydrolase
MPADRVLLVVAAPKEARAVCAGFGRAVAPDASAWRAASLTASFDIVESGVGKASAAGATARALDPARHRAVLSVGIAGLLAPGAAAGLDIGSVLLASRSVFADDGLRTPDAWLGCSAMGFPPTPAGGDAIPPDQGLLAELARGLSPLGASRGPVATVSECAGTDARAAEIASRTGAFAEAMEGAAAGLVAARIGVPFAEVRVISNTTGDRGSQRWDLSGAFARLEEVARVLGRGVTGEA